MKAATFMGSIPLLLLLHPCILAGTCPSPEKDCMGTCYNPMNKDCAKCPTGELPPKSIVCTKPNDFCCGDECHNSAKTMCCLGGFRPRTCRVADEDCCSGSCCLRATQVCAPDYHSDQNCFNTTDIVGGMCNPKAPKCPTGASCLRPVYTQSPFLNLPICMNTLIPTAGEQTHTLHVLPLPPKSPVARDADSAVRVSIQAPHKSVVVINLMSHDIESQWFRFVRKLECNATILAATASGSVQSYILGGSGSGDVQVARFLAGGGKHVQVKYRLLNQGISQGVLSIGASSTKVAVRDGVTEFNLTAAVPDQLPKRLAAIEWRPGSCSKGTFFLSNQESYPPQRLGSPALPGDGYYRAFPFGYGSKSKSIGVTGVAAPCHMEARSVFLPTLDLSHGPKTATVEGVNQGPRMASFTITSPYNGTWMSPGLEVAILLTHISPAGSECLLDQGLQLQMGKATMFTVFFLPNNGPFTWGGLPPSTTIWNTKGGSCTVQFSFHPPPPHL